MKQNEPKLLNPRVEARQTTRIAFVRHQGPENQIDKTFRRLVEWAGDKGLLTDGTKYIGVAHDELAGNGAAEVPYDCAITVGRDFRPEGEVQVGSLEAGEYAIVTYQGPYWGIDAAYSWVEGSWLQELGRQKRVAPVFEVYLNDPADVPEHQLLTDVHIPLEWW
jgi:AraC family transcriptional regulator